MHNRDTEADYLRGLFTLAAALGAGLVSRHLYDAAQWLGGNLFKDSLTLCAVMALVALGLTLRGVYLVTSAVRYDFRQARATR